MGVKKLDFPKAMIKAFYDDQFYGAQNGGYSLVMKGLGDLAKQSVTFRSPRYSLYFPLFGNVTEHLVKPLLMLIDQIPNEDDKLIFQPMSQPDQVEQLMKRIALL